MTSCDHHMTNFFPVEVNPGAWFSVLRCFNLQPSSFISSSSHQLVSTLLSNMASNSRACVLALRSLLSVQASAVVPVLVLEVCKLLGGQQVLEATDNEMGILHTPEGELWHEGMRKE